MTRDLTNRERQIISSALYRDADLATSRLVELRTLQDVMRERDTDAGIELIRHLETTLGVNTGIIQSQRNLGTFIGRYGVIIRSPLILPEQ